MQMSDADAAINTEPVAVAKCIITVSAETFSS